MEEDGAPKAKPMLEISSEHRLRQENLAFDIDVWYPGLKEFTFPTKFLPLTRTEAEALMRYYGMRFMERKRFFNHDVEVLNDLEGLLEQLVEKDSMFAGSGAFLRLCGRSVKDAEPLERAPLRRQYREELLRITGGRREASANDKLQAISKTKWLKINTAKEAMSLLLSSERVFADLRDWLEFGEPEQIVLRKWDDDISMDMEFRCFVSHGKLTAISQYDHYTVYPHLMAMKAEIQSALVAYWETLHPHVGEDTYIVDMAYVPAKNSKPARVVMIELSPFLPCTGPALFSWKGEAREILEHGPFQFRLRETEYPGIEALLEENWDMRWEGDLPPYWEFYKFAKPDPKSLRRKGSKSAQFIATGAAALAVAGSALTYRFVLDQEPGLLLRGALMGGAVALGLSVWQLLAPKEEGILLFVYGTLKRGFHWNHKFLSRSTFLSEASTEEKFPLVIGGCGVPYLLVDLPGKGNRIKGELWRIDSVSLLGLDEYEGVTKGHYCRKLTKIQLANGKKCSAWLYSAAVSSEELRAKPYIPEYTLHDHQEQYKAIRHILVKQQLYLHNTLTSVST